MSVTLWTRIEPDFQTGDPENDLAHGLAAELADPLWLLGRQWQMGEWQGENSGSPVSAKLSASSFPIDQLSLGTRTTPFIPSATPTDGLVEHDGGRADLAVRAAGGRTFLDALADHKVPAYQAAARSAYPFAPADASNVLERVLISTAIDGDRILADASAAKIAQKLHVAAADTKNFTDAANEWLAWYASRATAAPSPTWVPDRLEYQFSMAASVTEGRITLSAPQHDGGRIDWDTFTASVTPPVPAAIAPKPVVTALQILPVLLRIPGMPSPWFWEIEDPGSDYGRIEAGPSDSARLLLIEAALACVPDWFLLPLSLPVASLSRIDTLQIADTFGVTTAIGPVEQVHPDPGWSLWCVTQGAGRLNYLLLPPPNIGFATGEPIEKVAIVRDEGANLAWLLHKIPASRPDLLPLLTGPGDLVYDPMTRLPDARTPLVLTELPAGRFLVAGEMVNLPAPPPTELVPADFRIYDEELPDEGLTLRRRFELGRTPDGVLRLWISRATTPGARLPASGLHFDHLES
jgi:hypothetical protein